MSAERERNNDTEQPRGAEEDAIASLARAVADLRTEVRRLVHAKWDLAKLGFRTRAVWLLAWTGGLAAVWVVGVAGAGLATYGLALGIAAHCGDRVWVGYLSAGLFVVLALLLGLVTLEFYIRRRALREMERKYEGFTADSPLSIPEPDGAKP
jgi:hypothetical protein